MQIKLHKNAKTTLAIREYIRNSKESIYYLAKKLNLSWNTVKRWKYSEDLYDKSSCPYKLNTTLTKQEEELICFLRKQFKKSIDDIYLALKDKIPNLYPMKVYRCLKRYNLDKPPEEFIKEERKIKKFKHYGVGCLHIDVLEFIYNVLPKNKKTKKIHPFSQICQQHKINHRIIKFKHLWTHRMVESFNNNKRIKKNVCLS